MYPADHVHVDGVLGWSVNAALDNITTVLEEELGVVNPGVEIISEGEIGSYRGIRHDDRPAGRRQVRPRQGTR